MRPETQAALKRLQALVTEPDYPKTPAWMALRVDVKYVVQELEELEMHIAQSQADQWALTADRREIEAETIERCAQVVEAFPILAQAIRTLQPTSQSNIIRRR